jgi:hypothetical protein
VNGGREAGDGKQAPLDLLPCPAIACRIAFGEAIQHLLARAAVDVERKAFDPSFSVTEGVGEDGVLGRDR